MTNPDPSVIDPRIVAAADEGCEESRLLLSRRSMMGLTAAFVSSALIPRSALASSTNKRLLIVILRGGMDGLHVVMPRRDQAFLDHRGRFVADLESRVGPTVRLKESDFELHPALQEFGRFFDDNQAAIVHAIAPPLQNRSHFQCQYNLESGWGETNPYVSDGWLNRAVQMMPSIDRVGLRDAFAYGNTPFILAGNSPVHSWSWAGTTKIPNNCQQSLHTYYRRNLPSAAAALDAGVGIDVQARVEDINSKLDKMVDVNPRVKQMRNIFRNTARLMGNDAGPRIGVLSVDGWDTHNTMNSATQHGGMTPLLASLDGGIMDFRVQIGEDLWKKTVIVCVSEFGRTIQVNSDSDAAGTEHGKGTVALLAGGGLGKKGDGGNFYNEPPNLRSILAKPPVDAIMRGRHEIPVQKDTRALFKSVLIDFLGMDAKIVDETVFPGSVNQTKLNIKYS